MRAEEAFSKASGAMKAHHHAAGHGNFELSAQEEKVSRTAHGSSQLALVVACSGGVAFFAAVAAMVLYRRTQGKDSALMPSPSVDGSLASI